MGNELGQLREWDEKREQDWDILKYPIHDAFHQFMMELNAFYLSHPALYEKDYQREGFCWIDCNLTNECIYSFCRLCKTQELVIIMNFSEQEREYFFAVQEGENYQMVFSTDACCYGGSGKTTFCQLAKSTCVKLSAFTAMILQMEK